MIRAYVRVAAVRGAGDPNRSLGGVNPIGDANATFCATLVDEWVRCGVRQAVVAPGSRSTPLAIALAERTEVAVHVVHDERVASFVALGVGLDGPPAVLVCTSGTAAANFHPAVVEAGLSDVPMIVATADRPPELRGVGAPQTIDQLELYGRSVRWFHDAVVPDEADPAAWRPLAQRVFSTAAAGPVHLNLPFREPLLGAVGELPEPIGPPLPVPRGMAVGGPAIEYDRQRGVIVAGGRSGVDPADVVALADRLGWPILADPCSGLRAASHAITAFDAILRSGEFADAHAPEVVVRVGRPPASKVLSQWVVRSGAPVLQVGGPGVVDPDRNVAAFCSLADLAPLDGAVNTPWLARWRHAAERAEAVLDRALADGLNEPAVARHVARAVGAAGAELVVASSMPIRDVEWFGGPVVAVHANRGANGIDGVMSTALGRALGGRTVFVLLGDIAFVHDSNALVALTGRGADLRIVVVDNDGGGIFSFLPQATVLEPDRFEQLFGTPHRTDIVALASAHGIDAETVTSVESLLHRLALPGPTVTRVVTDRAQNVRFHAELEAAVVAALSTR
jgi:2-succinyl-5-enolpyruvyl-6-hydroxy-3-cyclohexene-1-carboxylate synthase